MTTSHQDGQTRDEEDQDGQNDFVQEICIEEQSNQDNKDSSDLDESEGSVFVPSVEESTDDEDLLSEESQLEKTIQKTVKDTTFHSSKEVKKAKQKSPRKKAKQKRPRKMTIKTSQRDPEVKRTWNKKQYCVYCEKAQGKIARHLERSHSNETEVAKAFSFPKRSKKRRILLEQLRNQGNYYHNIKHLETGRGEMVTWRQTTSVKTVTETGKKAPRRSWSTEEQRAVKSTLGTCFFFRKVPGKAECQSCLEANPVLSSRSWLDVKNFVHNTLQAMKRKLASGRNAV